MGKINLIEYLAKSTDIPISEAKDNLNELRSAETHENCNDEESSCKLCLLEQLLKDYRTFCGINTKENETSKDF